MRDTIYKWWNRKWSNWKVDESSYIVNLGWKKTILKRTSNDGLIEYKTIKNY